MFLVPANFRKSASEIPPSCPPDLGPCLTWPAYAPSFPTISALPGLKDPLPFSFRPSVSLPCVGETEDEAVSKRSSDPPISKQPPPLHTVENPAPGKGLLCRQSCFAPCSAASPLESNLFVEPQDGLHHRSRCLRYNNSRTLSAMASKLGHQIPTRPSRGKTNRRRLSRNLCQCPTRPCPSQNPVSVPLRQATHSQSPTPTRPHPAMR